MKKARIVGFMLAASAAFLVAEAAWAHGYGYHHHGRHGRVIIAAPAYHVAPPVWQAPLGRIDVEVEPRDAQVYVDGNFVGTAGKLDGWPSYLFLRQGTYKISLVHPGFETITHTVAIFPRQRMTLDFNLQPGESTPPPKPEASEAPSDSAPDEPAPGASAPESAPSQGGASAAD